MLASSVAGKLHCLSRLNLFIPCVSAFNYLSSSIIFTADTSSFSHPCCSVSTCSCKSPTWAHQYTGIHRAFQDVHGSQEPGCDKRGVNNRYCYSTRRDRCHDQCGACSGSPQLVAVAAATNHEPKKPHDQVANNRNGYMRSGYTTHQSNYCRERTFS